jgi:hypothetical protein
VPLMLAMGEHGGDEDLRGSDLRSVIPFIHGRIGVLMYCCVLNLPKRVLGF